MTVQFLLVLALITIDRIAGTTNVNREVDSTVSFRCEIDQLPFNAVITWVHRPKIHPTNEVKWLPLYANGRCLTQNNQRFIVDYSGYNERTKKYLSILTINQLKASDEGLYMCKSNQYQSIPLLFNLTISPAMKILPKDGLIQLDPMSRGINLSCTVRDHSTQRINPSQIKWYYENHEIVSRHVKRKSFPDENRATLILYIQHFLFNDSGVFKCVYANGKASKDVRILSSSSSSVIGYSKSVGGRRRSISSSLALFSIVLLLR